MTDKIRNSVKSMRKKVDSIEEQVAKFVEHTDGHAKRIESAGHMSVFDDMAKLAESTFGEDEVIDDNLAMQTWLGLLVPSILDRDSARPAFAGLVQKFELDSFLQISAAFADSVQDSGDDTTEGDSGEITEEGLALYMLSGIESTSEVHTLLRKIFKCLGDEKNSHEQRLERYTKEVCKLMVVDEYFIGQEDPKRKRAPPSDKKRAFMESVVSEFGDAAPEKDAPPEAEKTNKKRKDDDE